MPLFRETGVVAVAAIAMALGCTEPEQGGTPAALERRTPEAYNVTVGSAVPGGVTVRVVDSRGTAVRGSRVIFAVTAGDGNVIPHIVISDAEGIAHAEWTVGLTAGPNALVASIEFVDSTVTVLAAGTAGPAIGARTSPHTLRLPVGATSGTLSASLVDQYGNNIANEAAYTSRNPSLVTVNPTTGAISVVAGASGTTYVVGTVGNFSDSTYVIVLKSGDAPCTGITVRTSLAIGEVMTTGFLDNAVCIDGTAAGAEYAIVPYLNAPVSSMTAALTLSAFGIKAPGALNSTRPAGISFTADSALGFSRHPAVEYDIPHYPSERAQMVAAAPNARLWYRSSVRNGQGAFHAAAVPAVGDRLQLNTENNEFCRNPRLHTGRVVAVTQRAVVIADTANPASGLTDAEYQAFGVTFDTLIYPLDSAYFGAPTDIDDNGGRILLFFTRAVNDGGVATVGYVAPRDLLPKVGPIGTCPGSNAAEMMYLVVPDATYPRAFVLTKTIGTMVHELQHIINASRRLYINTTSIPSEERWLDEGIAQEAEELLFYRMSGLSPRQNIGSQALTAQYAQAYQCCAFPNFANLKEYLKTPGSQTPLGANDFDDDLPTRGATRSFLRYAADQRGKADEKAFWFKLVNSNLTGLQNLYEVVGPDARLLMRDWTLALLIDDLVPGINPKYQELSWNLRTAVVGYVPTTVPLPVTGVALTVSLSASGTVFARFGIAPGAEAYVSAAGTSGKALPRNVLLALVRTK